MKQKFKIEISISYFLIRFLLVVRISIKNHLFNIHKFWIAGRAKANAAKKSETFSIKYPIAYFPCNLLHRSKKKKTKCMRNSIGYGSWSMIALLSNGYSSSNSYSTKIHIFEKLYRCHGIAMKNVRFSTHSCQMLHFFVAPKCSYLWPKICPTRTTAPEASNEQRLQQQQQRRHDNDDDEQNAHTKCHLFWFFFSHPFREHTTTTTR